MSRVGEIVNLLPKTFSTEPVLAPKAIEQIRSGKGIEEKEFDQIFPPYYQSQSTIHWSPISVAQQISIWIKRLNRKSVVDIGCGAGKLCLLLRILTNYEIFGIEQRPNLV